MTHAMIHVAQAPRPECRRTTSSADHFARSARAPGTARASSLRPTTHTSRRHRRPPPLSAAPAEEINTNSAAAVAPEAAAEHEQPASSSAWLDTAATLTQLWALVLPLGYAGVPLAAQALHDVPGGACFAAAGVESAILLAVVNLLQRRQVSINIDFSRIDSLAWGAAAGAAALAVNQLLFAGGGDAGGGSAGELAGVIHSAGPWGLGALTLASTVLAPATEELMYRGFLLTSLRDDVKLGAPAGVALSAAAFALAHLQPAGVPQLLVVGLALGAASAAAGGNVAASFVGHALYNAALLGNVLLSELHDGS